MDVYKRVCKEWEEKTNLELEFTPYAKYIRRDVNSYITLKTNGEVKEKGVFLTSLDLQKAYHMPIVATALRRYFLEGIDIKKTIMGSRDIMDFCISRKSDSKFQAELHTEKGIENLQKTNRFFVSKTGGQLFMRNRDRGNRTAVVSGRMVTILNRYDESVPFDKYNVDFIYYIKETEKILDQIEPKQIAMFDMGELRIGEVHMTDFEIEMRTPVPLPDTTWDTDPSYEELKRLSPKVQNVRVKEIVDNRQAIKGIDPKYAYVMEYDPKKEEAVLFSFGRGSLIAVKVAKELYKTKQFKMDEILYCSKFKKVNDFEHELVDYEIDLKFKERHPQLF
jgi:hypothetical protein